MSALKSFQSPKKKKWSNVLGGVHLQRPPPGGTAQFWELPYRLTGLHRRFRGAFCVHLQPWSEGRALAPKCQYPPPRIHGVTDQRAHSEHRKGLGTFCNFEGAGTDGTTEQRCVACGKKCFSRLSCFRRFTVFINRATETQASTPQFPMIWYEK